MLHAGVGMHKRFSVVTVVDDSGNGLIKGKGLENRDLEIASFLKRAWRMM